MNFYKRMQQKHAKFSGNNGRMQYYESPLKGSKIKQKMIGIEKQIVE